MKKLLKVLTVSVLMFGAGVSPVFAAGSAAPKQEVTTNDMDILKLVYVAMRSRVFMQTVAKDYLYIGNDIATTKAQKEMEAAWKKFDKQYNILKDVFTDPKTKNLMAFVSMNVEEMKDLVKQPYSLDNAQEVIDLAESISEGNKKIAASLRKKLSKDYPSGKGQRYLIAQIAKYYMAYQAGIKDKNTIRHMNKTVNKLDNLITGMKKYPQNTVKMNQIMNNADKLWKIVKQFYVDIEEGGLPIIVYQTTRKLDKAILDYSHMILKLKAEKKK